MDELKLSEGDGPFLMHECDGEVTREETKGGWLHQWRTCTQCGMESYAGAFNLAAVQKLDLSKEKNDG